MDRPCGGQGSSLNLEVNNSPAVLLRKQQKAGRRAFAGDSGLGKELGLYPLTRRLSHFQVINPQN